MPTATGTPAKLSNHPLEGRPRRARKPTDRVRVSAASLLERRARDARSSGELSKLSDVKELTPCPQSNLTSIGTHNGTLPRFTARADEHSSALLKGCGASC